MSLGELWRQITTALAHGSLPDLGAWSYVILVLLVFIEGPAATLVAATMAAAGILRADLVFLVSVFANFLADVFWYLIGYSVGQGGRVSCRRGSSAVWRLLNRWNTRYTVVRRKCIC